MNGWYPMIVQAIVLAIALIGGYYKIDGRVMLVEHQLGQELKGYQILVNSLGEAIRDTQRDVKNIDRRLANIEGKLTRGP